MRHLLIIQKCLWVPPRRQRLLARLLVLAACTAIGAGGVGTGQTIPGAGTAIRGVLGLQSSFRVQGIQKDHQYTLMDAFTDVRVHPSTDSTESEVSIAVSPINSKVLLASANTTDYPPTTVYGTGAY